MRQRRILLTQHFVSGIVHPRAQIQAYVQPGLMPSTGINSIEVLATDCSGDLGYAVTLYESTNGDSASLSCLFAGNRVDECHGAMSFVMDDKPSYPVAANG